MHSGVFGPGRLHSVAGRKERRNRPWIGGSVRQSRRSGTNADPGRKRHAESNARFDTDANSEFNADPAAGNLHGELRWSGRPRYLTAGLHRIQYLETECMDVTSTATPDSAPNDAFIRDQDGLSDKVLDRGM